jgi:hypothetical protein
MARTALRLLAGSCFCRPWHSGGFASVAFSFSILANPADFAANRLIARQRYVIQYVAIYCEISVVREHESNRIVFARCLPVVNVGAG